MHISLEDIVKAVQSRQRHELANAARVSTTTLLKISAGKIPTLRGGGNFRVRKLWANALVRLARAFEQNPYEWLMAADIAPEESQQESCRVGSSSPEDALRMVAGRGSVHITCSVSPPFHHENDRNSFFVKYSSQLVRALNPGWELHFSDVNPLRSRLRPELSGKTLESKQLHIGPLNNVHRMLHGKWEFIPIPGLTHPLSAVYLPDRESAALSWTDCMEALEQRRGVAVVIQDDIAYDFLATASGPGVSLRLEPFTITPLLEEPVTQIVETLIARQAEEDQARTFGRVFFVADEETCRQVVRAGMGQLQEVDTDDSPDSYLPRLRSFHRCGIRRPRLGGAAQAQSA